MRMEAHDTQRSARTWRLFGAALSVVVAFVVATPILGAGAASVPRSPAASFRANVALLAHIPDGVRETCLLANTTYNPRPGQNYVALLECHPDEATTIEYRQYTDVDEMNSDWETRFTRGADDLELYDEDAECESLDTYSVGDEERGASICRYDESTGRVAIAWTYEPLAVIGILDRVDVDAAAARETWVEAGPDEATYAIPRVLPRRAVKAAAAELFALIPDASDNGCAATDLTKASALVGGKVFASGTDSTPAIWLDAEVVCKSTFPNQTVYRRYRDETAYLAAYDSARFLEYAEDDDPACPDGYESTWTIDDEEVGSVACYFSGVEPNGEAHLAWTYDPEWIVAESYALGQSSAQALYDWWNEDAGPLP